ncbi:NAD-dependent protein deacetylase [Comamonas flocculans]|uniref:NAD-dependent protein deacetylase n=1 Tax=Comamonas flocculans TaxID=2597701 RepID=A0A5B8RXX5_9BURK|nr:NAD-dependent protein deacetylase [Comamonas flocculans]QEA12697.1 NAD-dependent protein deacetylase [Comamonas flocculans]
MSDDVQALAALLRRHPRLVVLTGAGCSTESGIPDYRDLQGQWKRPAPMSFQAFTREAAARQRYWARSLVGWPRIAASRPGPAHVALAQLEAAGRVALLVTQNVDGLHQAAGSRRVIDLHGRLDAVRCLTCGHTLARADFQARLQSANRGWLPAHLPPDVRSAPDGDACLEGLDFSSFVVPACPACGSGVLKPDVVFFGESVPRERVQAAMAALREADALLVAGSSLMVFSGYRFARAAAEWGKPLAAVNLGRTRADELLALKLRQPVGQALGQLAALLEAGV